MVSYFHPLIKRQHEQLARSFYSRNEGKYSFHRNISQRTFQSKIWLISVDQLHSWSTAPWCETTLPQMFSRKILILGVKMEQQGVHNTCRWLQNQHRQQIDWITNAVIWEISIGLLSLFLVRFKKSFPPHMDIGHFLPICCLTTVELGRGEGKGGVDEGVG